MSSEYAPEKRGDRKKPIESEGLDGNVPATLDASDTVSASYVVGAGGRQEHRFP